MRWLKKEEKINEFFKRDSVVEMVIRYPWGLLCLRLLVDLQFLF